MTDRTDPFKSVAELCNGVCDAITEANAAHIDNRTDDMDAAVRKIETFLPALVTAHPMDAADCVSMVEAASFLMHARAIGWYRAPILHELSILHSVQCMYFYTVNVGTVPTEATQPAPADAVLH